MPSITKRERDDQDRHLGQAKAFLTSPDCLLQTTNNCIKPEAGVGSVEEGNILSLGNIQA